ncbi:MAG: DUF1080 domain-containing protein [Bryobacteraceae bacterium]
MKVFIAATFLLPTLAFAADVNSTPLFDGKTLKGWQQCNGTAQYKADGDAIVGTTVEGSPNSFLCTDRDYGDFILEYEVKADVALNSGVQIRSHKFERDTVVHTFNGKETKEESGLRDDSRLPDRNCERQKRCIGSIYDEARRGWLFRATADALALLHSKTMSGTASKWKPGDVIRTRERHDCANLVDSMDLTGVIALQVHAYKGEKPAQVRWRDIKIADLGKHVWRPIWDGKSLDSWAKTGGADWTVQDRAIRGVSRADDPKIGF